MEIDRESMCKKVGMTLLFKRAYRHEYTHTQREFKTSGTPYFGKSISSKRPMIT